MRYIQNKQVNTADNIFFIFKFSLFSVNLPIINAAIIKPIRYPNVGLNIYPIPPPCVKTGISISPIHIIIAITFLI